MVKKANSISEFCAEHDCSRTTYYKLKKEGKAPATMLVGRRRMISVEAAKEWRLSMANHTKGAN